LLTYELALSPLSIEQVPSAVRFEPEGGARLHRGVLDLADIRDGIFGEEAKPRAGQIRPARIADKHVDAGSEAAVEEGGYPFHGFSSQVLLVVAKSQDAKLEDDPSSNHAMTVGLQFAMPLPLSSFIAFSFLGRRDNPMPRKTFGALVNWTL
jgi:hypothetical protein